MCGGWSSPSITRLPAMEAGQPVWQQAPAPGLRFFMKSTFFFFSPNIFFKFTLQSDYIPPFPSSTSLQTSPFITPLPSPQRRGAPPGYHPALGHLVPAGLGTSSPTEAQPGSPGRGRGSNGRQQSQRQPLLQLLGDPHEDQAAHLLHM